ncbi:hypothetical protein [Desulfatibacillum aliphaticivorans]|uniref:hypothetical protein n=1 Tax=Desulfatibacillum aliphaticivorans TaxID=218208 RepID=UPI0004218F82|nr:hypothetical protein [Desulfatibacillum aliphaticivorans]
MVKRFIAVFVVLALAVLCMPSSSFAVFEELVKHPARSPKPYKQYASKAPYDRVAPAPDVLVDYLRLDNKLNGYPEVPKAASADKTFLKDVKDAVRELPAPVQAQLSKHLAGIFLVRELGTTSLTEVLTVPANEQKGFIVLDVDFISKPVNEWASLRANSPFAPDGRAEIKAVLEEPENDNRKAAIQYILIHQIGHLVGAAIGAFPSWNKDEPAENFAFSKISWKTVNGKTVSKFDAEFTMRPKIKFYSLADSSIPAVKIPECYAQLRQTDFADLYSSRNVWSDFAGAYSVYVHTVLQKKPWVMEIYTDGVKTDSFSSPLFSERGMAKVQFLESLFKQ